MGEDDEKIVVTPEMIEAGLLHLYAYHPEYGVNDEQTVIRIYSAMRRLASETPPATSSSR